MRRKRRHRHPPAALVRERDTFRWLQGMEFPIRDSVRAIGQQLREVVRTGDSASIRMHQKALNEALVAHMRHSDRRTKWRALSIAWRLINEAEKAKTRELRALYKNHFSGRMTPSKAARLQPLADQWLKALGPTSGTSPARTIADPGV